MYDFAFGGRNVAQRGPSAGGRDLGVAVLAAGELDEWLAAASSSSSTVSTASHGARTARFVDLFAAHQSPAAVVAVTPLSAAEVRSRVAATSTSPPQLVVVTCAEGDDDPLHIRHQIALKLVLNAHSTAIMCRLGRVCYNTMTNVSPSNLKLIGRATFLALSHIADMLKLAHLPLSASYADVNRLLHMAIAHVRQQHEAERDRVSAGGAPNVAAHQVAEVALTIVCALEMAMQWHAKSSSTAAAAAAAAAATEQSASAFAHAMRVLYNECDGSLSAYLRRFEARFGATQ